MPYAEGQTLNSLKQTEFSLKKFAKTMKHPSCSVFHKSKKVNQTGDQDSKYPGMFQSKNDFKQQHEGPPLRTRSVADCLVTFEY